MEKKKMKNIIENCSNYDLQQLAKMIKEEEEKRDNIVKAEINKIFIEIKNLICAIDERGGVLTLDGEEIDIDDLSWEWE